MGIKCRKTLTFPREKRGMGNGGGRRMKGDLVKEREKTTLRRKELSIS